MQCADSLIYPANRSLKQLGDSHVVVDWLIEGGAYPRHFQQSWAAHFGAARSFEYGSPADHPFEWSVLLKNVG